MIEFNELIMLLIGTGVLLFILVKAPVFKHIKYPKLLFASYCILFASFIFTVLEGFFLEALLNVAEQICYAVSTLLLATWCWLVFFPVKQEKPWQ